MVIMFNLQNAFNIDSYLIASLNAFRIVRSKKVSKLHRVGHLNGNHPTQNMKYKGFQGKIYASKKKSYPRKNC